MILWQVKNQTISILFKSIGKTKKELRKQEFLWKTTFWQTTFFLK
jgi:REP element-mobilizing transposase RayT